MGSSAVKGRREVLALSLFYSSQPYTLNPDRVNKMVERGQSVYPLRNGERGAIRTFALQRHIVGTILYFSAFASGVQSN